MFWVGTRLLWPIPVRLDTNSVMFHLAENFPDVSEEAKEHSKEVLEQALGDESGEGKNPNNVAAGLKGWVLR